ncbi:coiled-coil domain-containing protein 151-like isoform X2 [Limulus polyphemus]|uniref:Coiled-coil domain-containing protein 151-like isoform X2 n=1 Tax=Limulus polyphemus TaxID=6850 RepID=A0ABM1S472_LIMPO|nr:coiled-coil domain-containing protein 151-like isoform X2 [Limulus polyphemus]
MERSSRPVATYPRLHKSQIFSKTDAFKQHIQLLEGEQRAAQEMREEEKEQNKAKITTLRQELISLQRQLHKAETAAAECLDQKVFELSKKLDSLRHTIWQKQQRLLQLKQEHKKLVKKCQGTTNKARSQISNSQWLEELENRYETIQLKMSEARHINQKYKAIHQALTQEQIIFKIQVDKLEEEINEQQAEIEKLQAAQEKALAIKKATQSVLSEQEEMAVEIKRHKDKILSEYRNTAQQHRSLVSRSEVSPRKQVISVLPESPSVVEQLQACKGEQEKEFIKYEKVFLKIKEVTRVADIKEIEDRFVMQQETKINLEKLKKQVEGELTQLNEVKAMTEAELEDLKGVQGSKIQSELLERIEKCKQMVKEQEEKQAQYQLKTDQLFQLLTNIKDGLKHLLEIIESRMFKHHKWTVLDPHTSVLDLLESCEQRIDDLLLELQDYDSDAYALISQVKQDEFQQKLENTSIPTTTLYLPRKPSIDSFSSSEEDQHNKRELMKKQAQYFANAKMKNQRGRRRILRL